MSSLRPIQVTYRTCGSSVVAQAVDSGRRWAYCSARPEEPTGGTCRCVLWAEANEAKKRVKDLELTLSAIREPQGRSVQISPSEDGQFLNLNLNRNANRDHAIRANEVIGCSPTTRAGLGFVTL